MQRGGLILFYEKKVLLIKNKQNLYHLPNFNMKSKKELEIFEKLNLIIKNNKGEFITKILTNNNSDKYIVYKIDDTLKSNNKNFEYLDISEMNLLHYFDLKQKQIINRAYCELLLKE
jgi:hypothetical protein